MLAVVFANGEFVSPTGLKTLLDRAALLIAADGGAAHALKAGVQPQVLIGDLDSISVDVLAAYQAAGARVIKHPVAKEQTDLELALVHAIEAGADEIVILGGLGRRWDHSLANLLMAALPRFDKAQIRFLHGEQTLRILRGNQRLNAAPRDRVSLIPLGGDALGVTTTGLEFPLKNETLFFGSSRGVSNVVLEQEAGVSLKSGVLLCIISPPHLN